ncbi:MAG TPA: 3-dehydroquinate synthase [Chthoniobacterales bacterium]
MIAITVRPRQSAIYEAVVRENLLRDAGALVRRSLKGARCIVVSDENVAPLFAERVIESLRQESFAVELITIALGETSKTLSQAGALCDQLCAAGLDRSSFLISLGGGVVLDLVGFVASIFLRGIPYVSVPTTLLAQIDSCIGGKTGVNSVAGKNLIGSLHQPALVIVDTDTLQSLPPRIWNEGLAEAVKHGIIRDRALFDSVASVNREDPAEFIARNLEIKAGLIAEDECEEKDVRALLNFGHTVGHAIEHAAGLGTLLHGEAVSLGIVAAAHVSVRRAGLSLGECERIIAMLRACHLPTEIPPGISREKIFAALMHDKKFRNGRIRFVVTPEIGRAHLAENVTLEDLREAIRLTSA